MRRTHYGGIQTQVHFCEMTSFSYEPVLIFKTNTTRYNKGGGVEEKQQFDTSISVTAEDKNKELSLCLHFAYY